MFQFILAFMRAVILRPHLKVEAMMLKLFELRSAVTRAQNTSNGLTAIVEFFNATSPWHDDINRIREAISSLKRANYGQYDQLIDHMERFIQIICSTGRDLHDMNRTQKGELVTEDKVFLGGIWGIWTFNVQHWRTRQDAPKGCWQSLDMADLNPYDVICKQARQYVTSNVRAISTIITEIEKDLRELETPKAELAQTR